MKPKTLLVLALLVGALAATVFFFERELPSTDERAARAKKVAPFVTEHRLTFPVALDATMRVANAYGVRALPSSFIVGKDGSLTALALGPREWDGAASDRLVRAMVR